MRQALSLSLSLALLPSLAWGATFPDTPLQTGASRPEANIMVVLDDSGSMELEYLPDTLASGNFNRKNYNINPLAYNPGRTYLAWRLPDGSRMTGGLTYAGAYNHASLASGSTNLGSSTQEFYVPVSATLAFGNTTQSSYSRIRISTVSGAIVYQRCEWRNNANDWTNCSTGSGALPNASRTQAQELANYAAWYSYHRTRMKVAKAGLGDTFSQIAGNVRVGYNSIWGRNQFDIPVGNGSNGVFSGQAKQDFFDHVYAANGSGGTPLHGALTRAGEYFRQTGSSGPWGPATGTSQASCRQSFTILTTDGYWNNDDNYSGSMVAGNADGTAGSTITGLSGKTYTYNPARPFSDNISDTLADVAMKYWKNDLRTDLDNNVPSSDDNPAFWQHMVTFGLSIGLSGSLSPATDLPALKNGSKSWPNPWTTPSNSSPAWNNESPWRVDDVWHASINGHGKYYAANNPDEFSSSLKSVLTNIQRVLASGSNVSTSSTSLQTDTRIFHATYYSGIWTGDLAAYDISSAGVSSEPNWRAGDHIPGVSSRVAITFDGSNGRTFPTAAQAASLLAGYKTLAPSGDTSTSAQVGSYIKGDRSREQEFGGVFRNRDVLMGDIVNSSPVYAPETDTLFIGSNDGFLHAVNATTGAERFIYAPAGLDYNALGTLASPAYSHKYFVDGQIVVSNDRQTNGSNILVAALGRGGRGVFALDVTNPGQFGTNKILWDKTSVAGSITQDVDMGFVLGEPLIARIKGQIDVVMVPNGVDSPSGCPALFVYRLDNGSLVKKINPGDCSLFNKNGLSSPRGWDGDGDGLVDQVYAGDQHGNLWKFDFTGATSASWGVPASLSGQPLFKATSSGGAAQPISGGLALGLEVFGARRWIMFGTGRYLSTSDITDTSDQSVYGIIDYDTPIERDDLTVRDIAIVTSGTSVLRGFEPYSPLPDGKMGWVLDLDAPYDGERVIERGFLTGRAYIFPSVVPISGNACAAAGRGFLNAIDAFTGTSMAGADGVPHGYFDIGSDGSGNNDFLNGSGGSTGSGTAENPNLPVGSVETSIGMVTKPVLVGDQLVYGGSSGGKESRKVNKPPTTAKRLSWRELPAM